MQITFFHCQMEQSTQELVQKLYKNTPDQFRPVVEDAINFASTEFTGERRINGEPIIDHFIRVAMRTPRYGLDTASTIAALLHHAGRDKLMFNKTLNRFGSEVGAILENLRDTYNIETTDVTPSSRIIDYYLRHVLDIRYIFIDVFNAVDNMRSIDVLPEQDKKEASKRAFNIYSPLAELLNLNDEKTLIDEKAFEVLYPREFTAIDDLYKNAGVSKSILQQIEKFLINVLKTSNIDAKVFGRIKSRYSVHNKLYKYQDENNQTSLSAIHDIFAFTILTEDIETAYASIFALMENTPIIEESCHDYMCEPKPNGYSAYHMAIFVKDLTQLPIEVQVVTHDMYYTNTYGTASHIAYKMSKQRFAAPSTEYNWVETLHNAIQGHKSYRTLQFSHPINVDLGRGSIFTLTPKGRIIELPAGATVIDFAYRVHRKIGDRALRAVVDGHDAKLDQVLQNNQTVEIITSPNDKPPNPKWLEFAVTKSAHDKIRRGVKQHLLSQNK